MRTEIIMPNKTYHITLEKETSIIRKFASGKEFIWYMTDFFIAKKEKKKKNQLSI